MQKLKYFRNKFSKTAGTLLAIAVAVAAFGAGTQNPRLLVENGTLCGEIYIAENCDFEELEAALDLAHWIQKISGTPPVRVRTENFAESQNPRGIFVGKTLSSARANVSVPDAGDESYIIAPRGSAIFIVGKTPAASHCAAGKLLSENFGAEFVFPGDDGAEWTPQSNVAFPQDDFIGVPAWNRRAIAVRGDDVSVWARRLGFGTLPQFSHNLWSIFTPEIYADFPHLAPFTNGRNHAERRGGYAPQPNLAHADAPTIALAAAQKYFAENPEAPMFSVGINDCYLWDESADAERFYGNAPMRWFRNLPNRSDYFWSFADATARLLAASETTAGTPKKISAIAYLDCQDAPSFRLAENIFPVLCADRSQWIFPEFEAEDKALMRRWTASGVGGWGIYDYYYGNPFLFPRIFFGAQADSLKFAHEAGASLFYAEVFPQIPFDAPKIWLLAKLLENPKANVPALLEKFCELAYGNAAAAMRAFFELCEKTWREQGGQCRWIKGWNVENAVEIFPKNVREKCRQLLDDARDALPETPANERERRIIARLDATKLYWTRAENFAKSYEARKNLELRSRAPKNAEECAALLESPAWNFEKIYSDAAWLTANPDVHFSPVRMGISDPRISAFVRIVDALRAMPASEARLAAEEKLSELLKNFPSPRITGTFLRALVPALSGTPAFRENFEDKLVRDSETGEEEPKSVFVALDGNGWRRGKTLAAPATLTLQTAPGEKLFCGETDDAYEGKSALKISGGCGCTELSKMFETHPGERAALSVRARGNVSVGAVADIALRWRNADGKILRNEFVRLSCGTTADWTRFVVAGTAPKNAAKLEIFLQAGMLAPEDFVEFDAVELFKF